MMDIAEFLLARIAEDEGVLSRTEWHPHASHGSDAPGTYSPRCPSCRRMIFGSWDRARAECEAKRRIVEDWRKATDEYADNQSGRIAALAFGEALRALALPYADHPDYREEWRP